MSAASDTIASLRGDGAEIIAIGAVMLVLAVCSVVLRLLAKAVNEKEYGFDDVLVGFALASYLVSEALVIRAIDVGRRAIDGKSPQYGVFMQLTWIYSFLYWTAPAFATLSMLALYRRVFATHRFFSISSLILIILTLVWWISGSICDAISYQPVRSYWDTTGSITGQYILNYSDFWLASMLAELLIETAVLALPIREIVKLNLSVRKKVLVVTMFCMGGFVLITGIVRIYYSWAKSDMTPGMIWLSVHSSVSIISACLPTYRPLLARVPGLQLTSARRDSYSRERRGSYAKQYSKQSAGTKRSTPSAALKLNTANQSTRTSLDNELLQGPPRGEEIDWGSESTVAEDTDKGLELHDINSSQNGITRKISVPSPTATDDMWGPLGDTPSTAVVLQALSVKNQGPRTRRADLEYKRTQTPEGL